MSWHGWSRTPGYSGVKLHVGPLPGRKSIAVYSMDYSMEYHEGGGCTMHVHAYCRSVEEGEKLVKVLDEIVFNEKHEGYL